MLLPKQEDLYPLMSAVRLSHRPLLPVLDYATTTSCQSRQNEDEQSRGQKPLSTEQRHYSV